MDVSVTTLKVLLVEDSSADETLIVRSLRELPFALDHQRVASEDALRAALTDFAPDVILSDFSMPGFSGQHALELVMTHAPDVPFLFVSGTIGEELAIDALRSGAVDYVLKDNLRRLPSAVERALRMAEDRRRAQRMERELRESEDRFRSIVESSADWIWEVDRDLRLTYSNDSVTHILGYAPQDLIGMPIMGTLFTHDRVQLEQRLAQFAAEGKGWQHWLCSGQHLDGSVRMLESTATPQFDHTGALAGFRGVDRDVTERLQQEAQIRRLVRIHAVLSSLGNAVLRTGNRDHLLQQVCQVAVEQGGFQTATIRQPSVDHELRLTHFAGQERLADYIAAIPHSHSADDPGGLHRLALLTLRENRNGIVRDFATDPEVSRDLRENMARLGIGAHIALPIGNPPWGVMGLYAREPQVFDVEELALLQRLTEEIDYGVDFLAKSERLEFLAYRNPVSGLYNRPAFHARLEPWLQREPLAIALVDIIRFAAINESHGRAFGDALLQQAGQRLRELVGPAAIVSHPEGDSFAVACRAFGSQQGGREHLEELICTFNRDPFLVHGQEVRLHLRGGLAFSPEHGADAETLEHNAHAARLEASRRNVQVYVFNEELRGRATRRLTLEHELRLALEHEEFELFYQPKFITESQSLMGAEALLRWRHPQRGLVSPAEFIPLLEESGLIIAVGHWVMREALKTALDWRRLHPGLRIAVNVSSRELRHDGFMDECRRMLQPHVDDQLLDIEVTESLLMEGMSHSIELLQGLRDLGCQIAIDDFGTGYSSLNYLARLPVDTIKIDQSFVALLAQSPETMSLVTNIINLGHSLSLQLVAEGVEEEEQMKLLRLLRCDQLQGYLLGRPVPAAQFEAEHLQGGPRA